ncbi:MAG: methyltransferase domain-containing protein [Candidatus Cloacimonetes bacterium]|nr:methyltransferase domain-containing protein [Candidatus Cloacimonadota bacterium]
MQNPTELELEIWLRCFPQLVKSRQDSMASCVFLGFHAGLLQLHLQTGEKISCMSRDAVQLANRYPWLQPLKNWDEVSSVRTIYILSRRSFAALRDSVPVNRLSQVFVPEYKELSTYFEWNQYSDSISLELSEFVLPVNNPDPLAYKNIDLGGGFPLHPDYLCVDLSKEAQLKLDITKPLPFLTNSLYNVNCAHTLEHLSVAESEAVCREIYRSLRPGGVFRVSVPDLHLFAKKYVERDLEFYEEILPDGTYHYPGHTIADRFMYLAYDSGHRYFYDAESMTQLLKRSGFSEVTVCEYQKGKLHLVEQMDNRPGQSLFVEAYKAMR